MRHGEASTSAPSDFERPLTPFGIDTIKKVATWMTAQGIIPELIMASPAARTRQTSQTAQTILGGNIPISFHNELYPGDENKIGHLVMAQDPGRTKLMIVGHNPVISRMVEKLTHQTTSLAPGETAFLTAKLASWADVFTTWRLEQIR
jgi:phosphohistidine phosphatase